MQEIDHATNPFPGLRPFESNETHLFFGRDGQSEELLRRLKRTRFLAVVGTSGSGKSSLVRAGLLPALQGGLMASAGSDWRIAILRPGNDPIGNLARALASPEVLASPDEKQSEMQAVLAETTLRRSSLGLVELVSRARARLDDKGQSLLHDYDNLLIVVDQFEELFRFKQLIEEENSKEDAAAFVKLLLEAVRQKTEKIYVVLTMRSDFLGDCSQFWELPEAINNGQYLIPRMTRDERREAIGGPVAVGEGTISEPLINQLLNDVGDNPDQLPILQHALMRTWDHWLSHRNGAPMDIPDYKAIGGMAEALSRHADEAFAELTGSQQRIAEKLFKGLTEKGTDNREIRRPMEVAEICVLTGADEAAVIEVVEVFRREGRSFLMPPPTDPLTGKHVYLNKESLIDISHESLIRNWELLKKWVDDESLSASIYKRLAETAVLEKVNRAGLWDDPDLGVALTWRKLSNPNPVWAKRYHPEFQLAMSFLDRSVAKRDEKIVAEEARRRKEIRRTRLTTLVFALGFISSLATMIFALGQRNLARASLVKAEEQTRIAEEATAKTKEALDDATIKSELAQEANRQLRNSQDEVDKRAKEAEEQRKRAETQRLLALSSAKTAAANEKVAIENERIANEQIAKSQSLLYASSVGIAQKAIEDNNSERAQKLLTSLFADRSEANGSSVSETKDLRGFEWYYLWKLASRKLATLNVSEGPTPAVTNSRSLPGYVPTGEYRDPVIVYNARPVAPMAFGSVFHEQLVAAGKDNIARMWIGLSGWGQDRTPVQKETVRAVAAMGLYQFITADRTAVRVWSLPNPDPDAPPDQRSGVRETATAKLKGNDGHIALDVWEVKDLVAIGSGATFMLWNIREKEPIILADGGTGYPSVCFVENGEALITSDGRKLTRWNVKTRKASEIALVDKSGHLKTPDTSPFIRSVAFTPDARKMVTSSNMGFYVWTAANAEGTSYKLATELPVHRENQFEVNFLKDLLVAISPDGKLLATGDGNDLINGGGVKLWDIKGDSPRELFTLSPDVAYATSLDFSSDSRTLAVGSDNGVQLWDIGEKELSRAPLEYEIPASIKRAASLSPNGQLEAISYQPTSVLLWDTNADPLTKPQPMLVGTVSTKAVKFSPDGTLLAVGGGGDEASNGIVTVWDVQTRQPINAKIDGHKGVAISVTSLAFSPDNKVLATGATDKTIELWDISRATGRLLAPPLEGHKSTVNSLAYSPDGKTIASGDESGTVNLWSATSFQLLMTFKASSVSITSLAFSAKSDILFTKDKGGKILMWTAAPREQVDSLLQQASTFTPHFDLNERLFGVRRLSLRFC